LLLINAENRREICGFLTFRKDVTRILWVKSA